MFLCLGTVKFLLPEEWNFFKLCNDKPSDVVSLHNMQQPYFLYLYLLYFKGSLNDVCCYKSKWAGCHNPANACTLEWMLHFTLVSSIIYTITIIA